MPDLKHISVNNHTYDIRDATAQRNLTVGDGIAIDNQNTIRTTGIPYGVCDSTSTATAFTVTVPGIYKLEDGVCCFVKNNKITSAEGFTLNVNGLGAKPSYSNMATGNPVTPTSPTRDTTIFNINYVMLFVYSSTLVEGGAWICYRGYDANTNTIGYQLRHNSSTLPVPYKFYRYRLLFTSADGTQYIPANASSSTNATAKRDTTQYAIDPFGEILYYSSTTAIAANASPAATVLWEEYVFNLGYSFNRTGAALILTYPAPVYLKCAPQTNGSAIIEAETPYVQTLPSTNDGKIYILLGIAYSATNIELLPTHPVYYHDGTGIRTWTGKNEENPVFLVTLTANGHTITSDKTYDEILAAVEQNKDVEAVISTTIQEQFTLNQRYRYSARISVLEINLIGFISLGVNLDANSITTLFCGKENNTTTWRSNEIVIPSGVYINGDYYSTDSVSGYIDLSNALATVATTGSYNDLSDKPQIPSTSGLASTTYVDNAVAGVVNSAPQTLNTLNELATALGNDPNFATTVSTALGNKQNKAINLNTAYPQLFTALTNATQDNPVTLTGDALTQYNDLLAKYTDNNYTFLFVGTPTVIEPDSLSIDAMQFNVLYGGGFLTDAVSLFSINKSNDDYWIEVSQRALQSQLISGTNIKTINNTSLLGSGNISLPTSSDINAAKPFIVTVTSDDSGNDITYSADKTFAEIMSAYNSGRDIKVFKDPYYYNLSYCDTGAMIGFEVIIAGDLYSEEIEIDSDESIIVFGSNLQPTLTFDNTPTQNSNNPVKSGGVYSALQGKQDKQFIITITRNGNSPNYTFSADKTFNEITTAYNAGRDLLVVFDHEYYHLKSYWPNSSFEFFNVQPEDGFSSEIEIHTDNIQYISSPNYATVAYSGSYNDLANKPTIPTAAISAPLMDGAATIGSSSKYAKEDHVHPSDTSRVPISRKINNKPLSSDITLNASDVGAMEKIILHFEYDEQNDEVSFTDSGGYELTHAEVRSICNSGAYIFLFDDGTGLMLIPRELSNDSWAFTYGGGLYNLSVYFSWNSLNSCITCSSYDEDYGVPSSRTINSKELTNDITLTANDVGAATASDISTAISNLVGSAPTTLNTLNELAAALGDDPNFATTVTNQIAAKTIYAGSVAGKLYRNNVGGTGNFTVSGNSGCIPNIPAGTYVVAIYAKSATQSYTYRFNFGSVTYDLATTNGIINDIRTITLSSAGTFSGVVQVGSVASGSILSVTMYNFHMPVNSVGMAAVTNSYNDLNDRPTIPTVNNGTLTIQKNGTTVQTFTANQSSSVTANITVPTTASDVGAMSTSHAANAITSSNISSWNAKADVLTLVTVSGTGAITQALDPNKFYKFGSISSLTLTLNAASNGLAIYGGKFTASVDDMPITLPSGTVIPDNVVSIESGNTYEFNILDGVCIIIDVTAS